MTQQCHPRPRLHGDKLRRRTISFCHPRAGGDPNNGFPLPDRGRGQVSREWQKQPFRI